MALHDSDNWLIEASTAAESLPDPALVTGRTHFLHNNFAGAQTWTAPGATPFNVNGVAAANLVIPQGESRQVYAHPVGPDWHVVIPTDGPAATKSFRATGVTDASGNVTFNLIPAGFTASPVIVASYGPLAASGNPVDVRMTAISATSVSFNVRQAIGVTLLAINVLAVTTNLVGVTVHMIATPAGAQA